MQVLGCCLFWYVVSCYQVRNLFLVGSVAIYVLMSQTGLPKILKSEKNENL